MTKFKVCSKIHLFIIISTLLIAIGMAVGTICHFISNGFFNYGGEFSSYKSVSITYYTSEYSEEAIKPLCDDAFKGFNPYETSYGETNMGGEIVYKFSLRADSAKLQTAVDALNTQLVSGDKTLSTVVLHEGVVNVGGAKNIVRASIALASAVAFMFLYYVFRYKLRSAFSSLLACIHNLGLYVALLAITRIPLGTEAVAIGGIVVLVTMIACGLLFDRTRKNFKNEKYEKTARTEVIDVSACEVRNVTFYGLIAFAIASLLIGGAFACISSLYIGAYAPYIVGALGMIACCYGMVFFTPAVHSAIDATCEKVRLNIKAKTPVRAKSKTVKAPESAQEEK
ncbi:MAG: hypothetical protein ACI4MS_02960 [Candidatus Coproplasma sp.]